MRRLRGVEVSGQVLAQLIVHGEGGIIAHRISNPNIPEDADYIMSQHDPMMDMYIFIYSHPSFDPLKRGEQPPLFHGELVRANLASENLSMASRNKDLQSRLEKAEFTRDQCLKSEREAKEKVTKLNTEVKTLSEEVDELMGKR